MYLYFVTKIWTLNIFLYSQFNMKRFYILHTLGLSHKLHEFRSHQLDNCRKSLTIPALGSSAAHTWYNGIDVSEKLPHETIQLRV